MASHASCNRSCVQRKSRFPGSIPTAQGRWPRASRATLMRWVATRAVAIMTAATGAAAMRTIFIDCNDQLDQVFARVHRADDPPITVRTQAFERAELPRLVDGYD